MDLHQLKIGERVGKGGMGTVHRATWPSPGGDVTVAVKFMAGSRKTSARAAFLREARAAARLSHPNVVTLLDAGRVEDPKEPTNAGIPYLVMEWVDGETLADVPPENWEETIKLLRELLDALGHAHGWDVLHRDLKPANVMRDRSGRTRLMDFGIGRVLDDRLDSARERKVVGTPRYMAPEQVLGQWRDEGPWTDVYGLGAMAWHLVTGQSPFEGDPQSMMVAHVRERPAKFIASFEVPSGLRNWLYTALEKEPGNRFASAAEARAALDDLEDAERTSRYPVVTPGSTAAHVATTIAVPQRHVRDDRPVSSELRAAGAGLFGLREPPLSGRQTEKELLWNAFRRVSRLDRAEVAVVSGASGTGKTALARWLARRAREGGYAPVLESIHEEGVAGEAALTGALRRWFRIDRLDAGEALERMTHALGVLGFSEPRSAALDFVTRCLPQTSARRRLQDERDWHRFLLECAERIGGGAPTVWLFDDVHLSEASARFVEAASEAEFGLLVVATTRDESAVNVRRSFVLQLAELSDSAMRELVQRMLPLEPALTDLLIDRSEGSPMFARQLLADWVERDLLEPGPLGYRASLEATQHVPDSVRDVWRSRVETALGGLGEGAAEALRLAAVLGRDVQIDEWERACVLFEIATPQLVIETVTPSGLLQQDRHEVHLAHQLLRESLLGDIVDAVPYERAAADAVAALAETARDLERAARHYWAAGERLRALDQLYEAIVRYDDAEEGDAVILLVPLLERWAEASGKADNILLASALTRLMRTLEHRSGPTAARPVRERAEEIVFDGVTVEDFIDHPEPLANEVASAVLLARGLEANETDPQDALVHFAEAHRVAAAGGCAEAALIAASMRADSLLELRRVDDAYDVLEAALTSMPRTGLTPGVVLRAQHRIADMCHMRRDYAAAIAALDVAIEQAEAVGHREELAHSYSRRGDMHAYMGDLDAARDWTTRAREIYADFGSWVEQVSVLTLLLLETLDGRGAACRERAVRLLELARGPDEHALQRFEGVITMLAGACAAADGAVEDAQELLARASSLADVRVIPETPMLAVAFAEQNDGPLVGEALAIAKNHESLLPPVWAARLHALQG